MDRAGSTDFRQRRLPRSVRTIRSASFAESVDRISAKPFHSTRAPRGTLSRFHSHARAVHRAAAISILLAAIIAIIPRRFRVSLPAIRQGKSSRLSKPHAESGSERASERANECSHALCRKTDSGRFVSRCRSGRNDRSSLESSFRFTSVERALFTISFELFHSHPVNSIPFSLR